ncbi:MAG: hypothetical protein V1799_04845 [bacterium]
MKLIGMKIDYKRKIHLMWNRSQFSTEAEGIQAGDLSHGKPESGMVYYRRILSHQSI